MAVRFSWMIRLTRSTAFLHRAIQRPDVGDDRKQQDSKHRRGDQEHHRKLAVDLKGHTVMAVSIITGARQAGRRPLAMEFWMLVTSPVSLVTREEVRNRSVLEKENCWSFLYSSILICAPIP